MAFSSENSHRQPRTEHVRLGRFEPEQYCTRIFSGRPAQRETWISQLTYQNECEHIISCTYARFLCGRILDVRWRTSVTESSDGNGSRNPWYRTIAILSGHAVQLRAINQTEICWLEPTLHDQPQGCSPTCERNGWVLLWVRKEDSCVCTHHRPPFHSQPRRRDDAQNPFTANVQPVFGWTCTAVWEAGSFCHPTWSDYTDTLHHLIDVRPFRCIVPAVVWWKLMACEKGAQICWYFKRVQ
jgi:hypothetical protein